MEGHVANLTAKLTTAAIAAAFLATTAPTAFAYPGAPAPQAHRLQPTAVAFTLKSGQLQASQLIGSTVYDVQNRNIGSVKDVLVERDGKVNTVVLDVGSFLGLGGKYVAVSLNDLKTDNNRLTLDRSKEQLEAAAPFAYEQAENTPTRSNAGTRTNATPEPADMNKSDATPRPVAPAPAK
jgi:hypothetical protein